MCKLLSKVRNLNPGDWNICISTGIFVNASDTGKRRLNWFHYVPMAAFVVSSKTNDEVTSHRSGENCEDAGLILMSRCQRLTATHQSEARRRDTKLPVRGKRWWWGGSVTHPKKRENTGAVRRRKKSKVVLLTCWITYRKALISISILNTHSSRCLQNIHILMSRWSQSSHLNLSMLPAEKPTDTLGCGTSMRFI